MATQRWAGLPAKLQARAEFYTPLQVERLRHLDPELVLQINPGHQVGKRVWSLLEASGRQLSQLPPTHLLRAAFPDADVLLGRVAKLWEEDAVTLFLVPEDVMRVNEDIGYAAVSYSIPESDGGGLAVYAAIPWNLREYADEVYMQVAEAMVHEVRGRGVGGVGSRGRQGRVRNPHHRRSASSNCSATSTRTAASRRCCCVL